MLRNKRGITLVALVITIIVMLILLGVTITIALNGGLFGYAKNAVDQMNGVMTNEKELDGEKVTIDEETYDSIDDYKNGWKQNGTIVEKGDIELTVGNVITGASGELPTLPNSMTWKVLGTEGGKLILTSSGILGDAYPITGSTERWDTENNKWKFEEELDNIFSDDTSDYYINTSGTKALKIRSVKIEDINRVVGFDPKSFSNYGRVYTIRTAFKHPDGREIVSYGEGAIDVTNIYYNYDFSTYFSNTSDIYKFLTGNNWPYWTSSTCVCADSNSASFSLFL